VSLLALIDFLRNWVKDIAIMFILLSMVELVLPNENMKRYINVVIGFMIIVVIISPFVRLINSNFNLEKEVFKNMVENVQFQYDEDLELQKIQEKQIKETYLNKIKNDIKETLDGVTDYDIDDIKISIFEDEENYGNIKDIQIVMGTKNGSKDYHQDSVNTIKIEEIRINNSHLEANETAQFKDDEKIKDILNEKYSIPKDNIKVFINNKPEEGDFSGENH